MTTKTQKITSSFTCVLPNQYLWSKNDYFCATGLFFISCYSAIFYYASFLMQLTVYFASYLWRCYSEARGLYTATLTATSSSSLNRAEA